LNGTTTTTLKSTTPGVHAQYAVGDTVVTLLQVGTDPKMDADFEIGLTNIIEFPNQVASICDPHTSSYGPGTWDSPCAAATQPVRIAAKSWVNAAGKIATDFQPALRFVPGRTERVLLTLKDAARAGTRIDFCSAAGCVDEAAADPSLAAVLDASNGKVYRTIKHFSGYTVVAN
jgi:hypothetical protein